MKDPDQTVKQIEFLTEPTILAKGVYMQMVVKLKFLDDAIIRSNDAEEVLTFSYNEPLCNRFIIPWRKVKGKFRRIVMEKQRGLNIQPNCSLKDDLCMKCPSCFIFGGTGETSKAKVPYNILSRVMGETFISMNTVGEIEPYTQNAVDEKTLSTGQALMSILKVPAETEFIGVLTLKDPTKEMASIIVNNLSRLTRIGARSVEWGRIETTILGYKLSDREDLSGYNLASKKLDEIKKDLKDIATLPLPNLDDAYVSLAPQITQLLSTLMDKKKDKNYLFSWDEIPGNDNERLIEFLTQNLNIDWAKTAKIEKANDKIIKVSYESKSLSLKLDDEKTKVNIEIDDGRTEKLIAKTENGKLNIFDKKKDKKAKKGKYLTEFVEEKTETEAEISENT